MFKKILFATDFSDCAAHAQIYAFTIAARLTADVHIAHAVDTTYTALAGDYGLEDRVKDYIAEMKQQARQRLAGIADLAGGAGLSKVETHLLVGPTPETIVSEAERLNCDLLVVGKTGRSAFDHPLGSNALRIVRCSAIPVLTVASHGREFVHGGGEFTLKHVLCPCDLSPLSNQAVGFAAEICRVFGADLTLLHVIDDRQEYPFVVPDPVAPGPDEIRLRATDALNAIAAKFADIKVSVIVVTGVPEKKIDEVAYEKAAQLIVMSTHGRGGISRVVLGSTAERVVRTSRIPTLTIRPVS